MPPFEARAKAAMARSISAASRTPIGTASTPSDGATDWMAPNRPIPADKVGSRMTATRVTPGAISLSSSSHLPPMPYSRSETRGVAAGARKALDKAGAYRIGDQHEHDRHAAGRLDQRRQGRDAQGSG